MSAGRRRTAASHRRAGSAPARRAGRAIGVHDRELDHWYNVLLRSLIWKPRLDPLPESDANASFRALAKALASPERVDEVAAFLQDLCTPAELEAMADRWRVVPLLLQGLPYREIHERTQVSVTTVGRVARTLEHGAGGYAAAVRRQYPRLAPGH